MKVTAFIRKTAAKNNVTDQARVYFRVRDVGGVDIKAASELSINPNHWSAERQGYKPRVALVSEDKRMGFEKDIQNITHLIAEKYHRGVDGSWLEVHGRDTPCRRKLEASPRQSEKGTALRAFSSRGHAPAGLPPLYRFHYR